MAQQMHDHEKEALSKCMVNLDLIPAAPEYADSKNPTRGKCYLASRALLEFLGGKDNGYSLMRAIDRLGVPHYWVSSREGAILDATKAQYEILGIDPPYQSGERKGYRPMNRHRVLLEAMG